MRPVTNDFQNATNETLKVTGTWSEENEKHVTLTQNVNAIQTSNAIAI